jgi:AraC-like DNA-binding protein
VRAGEYVVIPPHHPHRVESLSDDFCKLTVAFDINGQKYPSSAKAWVADISDDISDLISLVSRYSAEKHGYSKELITLWLQTVLYIIMSSLAYKIRSEDTAESYDPRYLKAKKYVEDNYDVFFSCEEVAEYCRLSVKQLGRLFLQYEGVGLSEFIRKTKLDAAKRMLVSSEKSQKRISEELGFSSVSYFNKFFMKWV